MAREANSRSDIVGLLDLGTSKVCCFIVERVWAPNSQVPSVLHVLGIGHQRSAGVKAGVVIDLDQAETAIRAAVAQAERSAEINIEELIVSTCCGRMRSSHVSVETALDNARVSRQDLSRLTAAAREYTTQEGRAIVYLTQVDLLLDGVGGVRDPLNLAGQRLSGNYHVITADQTPLQNLLMLIDRTFLHVRHVAPAGLASALSTTSPDEREIGVIVVDFGAGATNIAAFRNGQYLLTDTLPFGADYITHDIAAELSVSLAEAERIKTLYGTLVQARSDETEFVACREVAATDERELLVTKAELTRIVQPRVDSQLSLLRERLDAHAHVIGHDSRIVVTGGASQLVGFVEFAAHRLQRSVRPGAVRGLPGMVDQVASPAFATVLGLAGMASAPRSRSLPQAGNASIEEVGYLSRIERWLRESF